MNLLMLVLISWTPSQQIDMLAIEDTLFIAMVESYQITLYRYDSTTLVAEADLGNYCNVSIGHSGSLDEQILLVVCSSANFRWDDDSLYAFDPTYLSLIWKTSDLPFFAEPLPHNHFLERWFSDISSPRLVSYQCSHITDASDEQWVCSHAFSPDTYPVIWEDCLYRYSDVFGYIDDLFLGPVAVADERILTAFINNTIPPSEAPGGWPGSWWVEIHVHEAETDSIMRVLPVAGGQFLYPPFDPRGYCLGSCSNHAVLLWSDTTGTIYSTEVAGSPMEIVSTEPFGFNLPMGFSAIAASRNPSDSGILISYYRDGYIRARYMEDSWFSYEHQVAPSTTIYGLTVSGTPGGYWIAWKDGSAYPNIAWIARETLTGISEGQSGTISDLSLTAAPNPFNGTLEVIVNSYEIPVQIDIYDTSGHLVHSGNTNAIGHLTWNAQSMPAGVYLIRAIHDTEFVDSKVLLIR